MDGFGWARRASLALLLTTSAARAQDLTTTAPASLGAPIELPAAVDAPKATETAPKSAAASGEAAPCCCAGFDWKKVPPIHAFPRPGFFPNPPKGCGYYSLFDEVLGRLRPDRPKYGYMPLALQPPPMFDIDWRYLDDPKTPPQDFLESLHRVHLGDNWLFNTGGEFRWRHMHEINSRLTGVTNDYELLRTRVYGDLWYRDVFRVYVEGLDARSYNQNLAPNPVDVDRTDLLDAFVEFKVFENCNGKGYVRVGRQELLYGSQRLISPPDWNNTRRTFQGVRGYYTSEKWDVDLFWTQPVVPNPSHFDSVDNNQNFAGFWATYRPAKGQFRDFYYLYLDNTNRQTQLGIVRAPYNVHTLGTRFAGDKNDFLYDVELMGQVGRRGDEDIFAAAATAGVGYHFEHAPMDPTFWLYYDFASGDQNPNGGQFNTFNQLFPFGHYYFGWLDFVGRQNIHDFSAHMYLYPTKWLTFNAQFHHFELASARDALYNAAGNAIRRDPTGAAGRDVGDEIDLIFNFHLTRRSDFLIGYSQMWEGSFLKQTGPRLDPSLFYAMYNFRW
ncbi:MAG: alginate export family protein [Gemmataceae bacterium]